VYSLNPRLRITAKLVY